MGFPDKHAVEKVLDVEDVFFGVSYDCNESVAGISSPFTEYDFFDR
jgi:hypothetical protein